MNPNLLIVGLLLFCVGLVFLGLAIDAKLLRRRRPSDEWVDSP